MKHKLKVVTINMCTEFPEKKQTLLDKWIFILSQIKADIIFLQEMESFNIERLANALGLKILTIHQYEATCVLLNPNKLTIVDNSTVKLVNSRIEPFYVGGLHLSDIPSVTHHLNHIVYKSSETIPLSTSLAKVLKRCVKTRVPRVTEELLKTKPFRRAIIAGDFNEPSHLDLDKIDVPVSKLFAKHGFEDTYKVANKKENGYTWPASSLYKNEPDQRIDMIYTKNMRVVKSDVYEGSNSIKWISDHKMVITDIEL